MPGAPGLAPPPRPDARAPDEPLLTAMVTKAQLETLLPVVGIRSSRAEIVALLDRLEIAALPYKDVWEALRPLKGLAQWQRKINTLAGLEEFAEDWSATNVGEGLFRRVRVDQAFGTTDLQLSPDMG